MGKKESSPPDYSETTPTFTRGQFLWGVLGFVATLPAGCKLLRPVPPICSTPPGQGFRGFDVEKLLAQANPVLLTPDNTNSAVSADSVRSVALTAGKTENDRGFWIGYGARRDNAVAFLHLGKDQGLENCGPVGSERIRGRINAIAQHPTSGLVIAAADRFEQTDEFGVYMLDPKQKDVRWTQHLPADGLTADQCYDIAFDDEENILVATWSGISQWNRNRWMPRDDLMPNPGIKRMPTHAILVTKDDYWLGFIHEGIFRVNRKNPSDRQLFTTENTSGLDTNNIRDLQLAPDGKIWVTGDPGVSHFDPQTGWQKEILPDPRTYKEATAVRFDSRGRPWLATDKGTLFKDGNDWLTYSSIKAFDIAFAPAGFAGNKEELVIAATQSGLLLGKVL